MTPLVEKATSKDLPDILGWLEREYEEDGEGFWSNRNIVRTSLKNGDLWVIRENDTAVAFQVGDYAAAIANVRKDRQRRGYGAALFEAALGRAVRDDVNVLRGECSPRNSLPFWQKRGFERYGDLGEWSPIYVRRVLHRAFDVGADLPRVEVTVSFYPEAATHDESVPPLAIHRVLGGRRADGVILLERRIVGLCDEEPCNRDLAVRIEVDGVQRCFCKAKYDGAVNAGMVRDWEGQAFYIDAVLPEPADRSSPARS